MKISAEAVSLSSRSWDLAACVQFEDDAANAAMMRRLPSGVKSKIAHARALGDFAGKKDEAVLVYTENAIPSPRLLIAGAGTSGAYTLEHLRRSAASAVKKAKACKAVSAALLLPVHAPQLAACPAAQIGQAMAEAAILALYAYDRHKTKETKPNTLRTLSILVDSDETAREFRKGIAEGTIIAEAVIRTRDLANAPAIEVYPASLADAARRMARETGIRATVLDRKKIEQLGMGGVTNVGKGSAHDPRFIILDYKPQKSKRTVVLVGKGVTFDSGGISIKPSAGMGEMRADMHGGASVIGTLEAAARLKLPVHLVGLVPAVENMPSGTALKPGDIITHYNGMTTEVDNTDAEGRLILADALSYAARYKPDVIIDLATLTGAAVVALGHHAMAMLGTDETAMADLKKAGDLTYERVWQLPLFEEYNRQIKSDVADVKNVGGRWGGAITAAAFLKHFVGDHPWVHLDIAGPSFFEEAQDYIPKGATGVGVRLLIEYLRTLH